MNESNTVYNHSSMADTFIPVQALKGRGAATRLAHRFERDERAAFDDGWGTLEEGVTDAPPPPATHPPGVAWTPQWRARRRARPDIGGRSG